MAELQELITAMTGLNPGDFTDAFRLVGVAEDEIDVYVGKYPRRGRAIWNSFGMLNPGRTNIPGRRLDNLFLPHIRELLKRVATGGDTRLPTAAEMLVQMSEASTASPMSAAFNWAYFETFVRCFGDLTRPDEHPKPDDVADMVRVAREWCDHHAFGTSENAKDGVYRLLNRRMVMPERVLPDPLKPLPAFVLDAHPGLRDIKQEQEAAKPEPPVLQLSLLNAACAPTG